MTLIYLVRHGQASFGAQTYDQLSLVGEQQAICLGQYLAQILPDQPEIMAGDMQRHQQTMCLALAESFPKAQIKTTKVWNEFDHQQIFSRYTPRFANPALLKAEITQARHPREYLAQIFSAAIARWTEGEFDHDYDETWPAFQQRVEQGLADLCQGITNTKPQAVVVFTSGGVISVVVGKLLGLSPAQTFQLSWSVANCSLTTLRVEHGQPELLSFNEHQYLKLQPDLLTWL